MPESTKQNGFPRYAVLVVIVVLVCMVAAGVTMAVRDREDKEMANQLERTESELRGLGGQIASIKDADLGTANDFISAYAQIEPLEKEYEVKLQRFTDLYTEARERDSHRGWLTSSGCAGNTTRKPGNRWRRSSDWFGRSTKSRSARFPWCTQWPRFPKQSACDSGTNSSYL